MSVGGRNRWTVGMNNLFRACAAATLITTVLALSSCSPTAKQWTETFELTGQRLDVVNYNANMPVDTSEQVGIAEVVVTVRTKTIGKNASTPDWSLEGATLNLDTPCDGGMVGYCEGGYSIVVPAGTTINLNGYPVETD